MSITDSAVSVLLEADDRRPPREVAIDAAQVADRVHNRVRFRYRNVWCELEHLMDDEEAYESLMTQLTKAQRHVATSCSPVPPEPGESVP